MSDDRPASLHGGSRVLPTRRSGDRRFFQAAENAPFLLWLSDAAGSCDFFNHAWLAFTGRSPSEEMGDGWMDSVHPEDVDELRAAFRAAVLSAREFRLEHRLRRHDGEFRWVLNVGTPLHDAAGSVSGFVGSCIDVTDRRRLEDRTNLLLRIDDRLRSLVLPHEITYAAAELLANFLNVNRCVYADVDEKKDIFHLTGEFNRGVPSVIGQYPLAAFGQECRDVLREGRAFVVSDAETDPRTVDVRDSYRQIQARSLIAVPLFKQGEFAAALAVHQNTARLWGPEEIEVVVQVASRCWESLERARITRELLNRSAVVENSNDAIITMDLNGVITSWNKSAERIFWYKDDELIGKPITVLYPPDHANEELAMLRRIRAGEIVDHYETVRRRKDGTLLPISLTISPVRSQDGVIIGASKIARDISAQKAYERQLIDQANELEQFAYVASHDLQEPLRKLSVYSELLVKNLQLTSGSEGERYVSFITDAVNRMRTLISELLNYSRASRSELNPEPVNLTAAANGVLSDLEIAIRESRAHVNVHPMPRVMGNPFQVHQLLQNLIGNAVKFRDTESPRIDVSARECDNDVLVAVKDNGIGIEPQYQDRVFRVFQRLHSTGRYPGTGIGLAICKKIVERHGGRIWLESEPGKGTTFYFTLPAARS